MDLAILAVILAANDDAPNGVWKRIGAVIALVGITAWMNRKKQPETTGTPAKTSPAPLTTSAVTEPRKLQPTNAATQQFLQFLGISGDIDLSTPEKFAHHLTHLAERWGQLLANRIVSEFPPLGPESQEVKEAFIWSYAYPFFLFSAMVTLQKVQSDFNRATLSILQACIGVEKERRGQEARQAMRDVERERHLAADDSDTRQAQVAQKVMRPYTIYDGCTFDAVAKRDYSRMTAARFTDALLSEHYASQDHQKLWEPIFTFAIKELTRYMVFAFATNGDGVRISTPS